MVVMGTDYYSVSSFIVNVSDHIVALRKLMAAYPEDLEARSILGLALLDGYDPVAKQPRTNTTEAFGSSKGW